MQVSGRMTGLACTRSRVWCPVKKKKNIDIDTEGKDRINSKMKS